jgi:hypothetical protein
MIKIYEVEKELGLEQAIASATSVAFTAGVMANTPTSNRDMLSIAETLLAEHDDDIYPNYSILVSTTWNKNDDIFNNVETWAARHTPRFKPTNLDHDEQQMVGGIVNSWAIDTSHNLIADDIDIKDLPDFYHILVASVIYRRFQDPELQARADALIEEIEAGDRYVSMECMFRGFDYGVIDPSGNNHIIIRSEATAFLSQHLRAYGGSGFYQDHKIGRVLRNITFSGKGYVLKPANEDSVIFNKDHIFSFANAKESKSLVLFENGVTINENAYSKSNTTENENMSIELLQGQIKDLKDAIATLTSENKDLNDKLSMANSESTTAKIGELEADLQAANDTIADVNTKLAEAQEKIVSIETDLNEKTEALKVAEETIATQDKEKKEKERKEKMAKSGLSEEQIEDLTETFASLTDDQFEKMLAAVTKVHRTVDQTTVTDTGGAGGQDFKETVTTTETLEVSTVEASEVVDTADTKVSETENANISMSGDDDGEDDDLSKARAGLTEWAESFISSTK